MKKQTCEKMRLKVDSEINESSAKSLFEMLYSVDLIINARNRSWFFVRVNNQKRIDHQLLEIKHDSSWAVIDRQIDVVLDDELKKIMSSQDDYMNKTVLWLAKDSKLIDKWDSVFVQTW